MSTPRNEDVLGELLALIGSTEAPQLSTDDVNEIFQRGVPLALKEQLKLITGGGSEKIRAWMIKEWLDRSGYTPVTKIAVAKKITLDEKTLRVLSKIAEEDVTTVDSDSGVCEAVLEAGEAGPGSDPARLEAESQEVALLPEQGDLGLRGPDPDLSPEDVSVRAGSDDKTPAR